MTVLLHACCAPCLSGSRIGFETEEIPFTVLWYNPNIQPLEERLLRENTLMGYCSKVPFELSADTTEDDGLYREYQSRFLEKGDNPYASLMDLETRCDLCYLMRLLKSANVSKEKGHDGFSTTLLLSKYQKHDRIIAAGQAVQDSTGQEFVYLDLRRYWGRSLDRSREYRLYRQRYCGCELSLGEAVSARSKIDQHQLDVRI